MKKLRPRSREKIDFLLRLLVLRQISFFCELKAILRGGEAREKNARRQPSRLSSTFLERNEAAGQKRRKIGKNLSVGALVLYFSLASLFASAATNPAPEIMSSGVDDKLEAAASDRGEAYKESPLNFGLDLQYSPIPYKKYSFNPGYGPNNKLAQGLHIGFEWIAFATIGKLGIGMGGGFFVLSDIPTGDKQYATLYTIPFEAAISYRFDYVKDQVIVPFVKFGADATLCKQGSRSNGMTRNQMLAYYGYDFGGGFQVNLDRVEPKSAHNLERSAGINNTYLVVEFVNSSPISEGMEPDLSYEAFRVGLRFEM